MPRQSKANKRLYLTSTIKLLFCYSFSAFSKCITKILHFVHNKRSIKMSQSETNNCSEIKKPNIGPIDAIGDVLDNCPLWQLRAILIIFLTKIPTAFFMAAIIYSAPVPERVVVYCREGTEGNITTIVHPAVADVNDQEFKLSLCDTYDDIKTHAWMFFGNYLFEMPWIKPNSDDENILPCDVFDFKSGNPNTWFDIVCSRGALVVLTQGMHLVGILLSGVVARYSMKT